MRKPANIRIEADDPETVEAVRLILDTLLNVEGGATNCSIGSGRPGRNGGYLAYGSITVDLPDKTDKSDNEPQRSRPRGDRD